MGLETVAASGSKQPYMCWRHHYESVEKDTFCLQTVLCTAFHAGEHLTHFHKSPEIEMIGTNQS